MSRIRQQSKGSTEWRRSRTRRQALFGASSLEKAEASQPGSDGHRRRREQESETTTSRRGANEWGFKAPEAELIDAQGRLFAKHYAGPTWEAPDGSKIVGKILANEPAPKADAIPWLLLSAESSGSGVLAGARFVQRIDTSGGVGPTGACPTAGTERRAS